VRCVPGKTWAALLATHAHNRASDHKIEVAAFPAMGTGYGGVPYGEAARQMAVAYRHFLEPPHRHLRMLRPSRIQFTLRGIMISVAIAGLILGFFVWLSRWVFGLLELLALLLSPASTGFSQEVIFSVGPYSFSSASPAFWPALCIGLTLLAGILAGFLAVVLLAAKAMARRIRRKA
jgi:hypothetical protein